jgi:hypothetical protein
MFRAAVTDDEGAEVRLKAGHGLRPPGQAPIRAGSRLRGITRAVPGVAGAAGLARTDPEVCGEAAVAPTGRGAAVPDADADGVVADGARVPPDVAVTAGAGAGRYWILTHAE